LASRDYFHRIRRLEFAPASTRYTTPSGDVGRNRRRSRGEYSSSTLVGRHAGETLLDYALLRRALLLLSFFFLFFAPLTLDPVAFAVGALVLPLIVAIVGTPTMPAAVAYLLAWQWVEIFAQVLLSSSNGETLETGVYGPNVARAYWYMMASLIALACGLRMALGNLREPPVWARVAHRNWRPVDLFVCYLISSVVAAGYGYATNILPSLDQQLEAVSRIKIVALFVLFSSILSTRKGTKFLVLAIFLELASGFGGLFSDFKSVFVILGAAAVGARIRWTNTMGVAAVVWLCALTGLALFWTAVKSDYRQFATGSDESQYIRASLGDRYSYLGDKAASVGSIDWGLASYAMLTRLAYVDIFGSVIGVNESTQGGLNSYPQQWTEAIEHITKPRFLFPDKAQLSDTATFARLALGNATEEMRGGTSISVGYMAENYVDLGFPGMLGGIFVLGLILGGMARYFMMCPLPWLAREGIVLALIYTSGHTGVEGSLPKIIGAAIMFTIVYVILVKFAFNRIWNWLDERAALG
jgi:hypothetical protein